MTDTLARRITFGGNTLLGFRAIVDAECSPTVAQLLEYAVETAGVDYVLYGRPAAEKRVLDTVCKWVDDGLIVCECGRWEMVP